MAFSLRLRLDSILTASSDASRAPRVKGLQLGFTTLGASVSNTKRDARLPAKVEFVGRFTKTLRDKPAPEETPLGELTGQIEVTGDPLVIEFACDPDSLSKLTEEPEPDDETDSDDEQEFSPRSLDLILGSSFSGLDALGDDVPRLFLPNDSGRFRYLEICAKLTVSGSTEADFDQNDILDILINLEPPPSYPFSF